MSYLLTFILSPLLLAILYPLAIQTERGGWWRILWPLYAFTGLVDVFCNYTSLALYTWDYPKRGETTFTKRLNRLRLDVGWRGDIAWIVCWYLDKFDPTGKHCK